MTEVMLKPTEFIIRIEGDIMQMLAMKQDAKIQLVNPHKDGEFDDTHWQVLKLVVDHIAEKK